MPVEALVQQAFALFDLSAFSAGFVLVVTYFVFGWFTGALFDLLRK
jgi:hypothetical protein